MKLIPVTGYNAWFTSADDYDVFALPIIGVVEHLVSYDEMTVEPEHHPVVLDHSGTSHELADINETVERLFFRAALIGVAPAGMDTDEALEHLARYQVPLDPHSLDEERADLMVAPIVAAQARARGETTVGRLWEPESTGGVA